MVDEFADIKSKITAEEEGVDAEVHEEQKKNNFEALVEESIDNIRNDRAMASMLLIELAKHIKVDDSRHQYSGPVAAKYLETLQRSNEQLVKIVALLQKKQNKDVGLSEKDKDELFDVIKEVA